MARAGALRALFICSHLYPRRFLLLRVSLAWFVTFIRRATPALPVRGDWRFCRTLSRTAHRCCAPLALAPHIPVVGRPIPFTGVFWRVPESFSHYSLPSLSSLEEEEGEWPVSLVSLPFVPSAVGCAATPVLLLPPLLFVRGMTENGRRGGIAALLAAGTARTFTRAQRRLWCWRRTFLQPSSPLLCGMFSCLRHSYADITSAPV
jgi:hypothetical protein